MKVKSCLSEQGIRDAWTERFERNRMKSKFISGVMLNLLLAAVACAQSTSTLKGIRIKGSSFDPQSYTVKLAFINDSVSDITAWGYCVLTDNSTPGKPEHGYCTMIDPAYTVIDHKIEVKKRPFLPEPDCPMCRFLHPGQEHVLSFDLSQFPEIAAARIEINLIAYSDGSAEILPGRHGKYALKQLTDSRRQMLEVDRKVVEIGKQVLSDSNNQHPVAAMIRELAKDSRMAGILEWLKKPEWHKGNEREYVPENEREYLAGFVAEHEVWVAMLVQQQIKGDAQ